MTAADAIRDLIAPLLPGWRIQFGRWVDGSKTDKYAVIKPFGGALAGLVRRPQFTLILIGAIDGEATVPIIAAEAIIEAIRVDSGALVSMEAGEPVHKNADDGRPIAEFLVSTITN
jgi:hypothetical protein